MRSVDVDTQWPELLARVQAGDERAFSILWRRHQPSLVRYLVIVAGRDVAEDLAAETWIGVVRTMPRFRGEEAGFKSLLYTTARSRMIDGSRRVKARPLVSCDLDGLEEPPSVRDDVGSGVEQAEATRGALTLIARLPAGQAEVVALRVIAGLDTDEVARLLAKRAGTVRVAYSRGITTLARMVGDRDHVTDPDLAAFR